MHTCPIILKGVMPLGLIFFFVKYFVLTIPAILMKLDTKDDHTRGVHSTKGMLRSYGSWT
jgi:hypothetical protein